MSKKSLIQYSTIATGKINTLKWKYSFSPEAWNAYHELLALREFARDMKKNSDMKLYDKHYYKLVNSGHFGMSIIVEQTLLRSKEVR